MCDCQGCKLLGTLREQIASKDAHLALKDASLISSEREINRLHASRDKLSDAFRERITGEYRIQVLESILQAMWDFIENVNEETPDRTERFFTLRERYRDVMWREEKGPGCRRLVVEVEKLQEWALDLSQGSTAPRSQIEDLLQSNGYPVRNPAE